MSRIFSTGYSPASAWGNRLPDDARAWPSLWPSDCCSGSSASAVASAANLASVGALAPSAAATGALLASVAGALVHLPIVARVAGDGALTRRVGVALRPLVVLGAVGVAVQMLVPVIYGSLPEALRLNR
jgi:hypothetical protein